MNTRDLTKVVTDSEDLVTEAMRNGLNLAIRMEAAAKLLSNISFILTRGGRAEDPAVSDAVRVLHAALYKKESEAYRSAFMFSAGAGVSQEELEQVRHAAYRRFLEDGWSVVQYLDPGMQHPGTWSTQVEQEFRKQIRSAFGIAEDQSEEVGG